MGFFGDIGNFFSNNPVAGIGAVLNPVGAIGTLLGGGADIIGGIAGMNQQDRANQAQIDMAYKQIEMAKEFAQNGIRWRVADAEAAGLHPLAALGASGASYSGSAIPLASGSANAPWEGVSRMGQNISRSVMATASPVERARAVLELQKMTLENEALDLQNKASKMALMNQVGPTIPGFSREGGEMNSLVRDANGNYVVVPSKEMAERSGGLLGEFRWTIGEKVLPAIFSAFGADPLSQPNALTIDGKPYHYFMGRYVPGPLGTPRESDWIPK